MVEFGEPDRGGWVSYGSTDPCYVIAESYDEAAQKALVYKSQSIEPSKILDWDGSLNIRDKDGKELKVKSVKIVSNEIII